MKTRAVLCALGAAVAMAIVGLPRSSQADDTAAIDGTWEGPWYRGMSSGRAMFRIQGGGGSLQLTNGESFGDEPRPLSKVSFDGRSLRFQVDAVSGPLTATLKLDERGDQMKGMGKYQGFGVRFELTRVAK